jgi:hypothetical protein
LEPRIQGILGSSFSTRQLKKENRKAHRKAYSTKFDKKATSVFSSQVLPDKFWQENSETWAMKGNKNDDGGEWDIKKNKNCPNRCSRNVMCRC